MLWSHVCRNYKAINFVETLYPYEVVFQGLVNPDLPLRLRTAFCKLMLAVHVDREPQVRCLRRCLLVLPVHTLLATSRWLCCVLVAQKLLQLPNNTRIWNDIHLGSPSPVRAVASSPTHRFDDIKNFISEYFAKRAKCLRAWELEQNVFTLQVLALCKFLVAAGFYSSFDDLKQLVLSLVEMLNGTTDETVDADSRVVASALVAPTPDVQADCTPGVGTAHADRYVLTEWTKPVMEAKVWM